VFPPTLAVFPPVFDVVVALDVVGGVGVGVGVMEVGVKMGVDGDVDDNGESGDV
jgi:hypothetical protein